MNTINRVNDPLEGYFRFIMASNLYVSFINYNNTHTEDLSELSDKEFDKLYIEFERGNLQSLQSTVGVSCFSNRLNSIMMWGHYADNHKGICIEFSKELPPFNQARKVEYNDDINTIPISSKENLNEEFFVKTISNSLFRKREEWRYENEQRIVYKANEALKYDELAIKAIYFGIRSSNEDIELVIKALKDIKHLKYFKCFIDGDHSINFEQIDCC